MHTSGCRVGIGSVAAMEEVMEIVSAEEMLCGPRNTASCNSTLLDEDSSRTGHNNWKLMVSRKSLTHENIEIKLMSSNGESEAKIKSKKHRIKRSAHKDRTLLPKASVK
jgi:hypothetical protein